MSDLRVQQSFDRRGTASPLGRVEVELLSAGAGQRVVLGAARVLCVTPLGIDEPRAIETFECGEERSCIDLEYAARNLLDALRDAEAVHRLETQGLEDQEVECS